MNCLSLSSLASSSAAKLPLRKEGEGIVEEETYQILASVAWALLVFPPIGSSTPTLRVADAQIPSLEQCYPCIWSASKMHSR